MGAVGPGKANRRLASIQKLLAIMKKVKKDFNFVYIVFLLINHYPTHFSLSIHSILYIVVETLEINMRESGLKVRIKGPD